MTVARMAPMPAFDRVLRPCVLVLGYTGRFADIADHAAVKPLRDAALRALSARSINLDTTHFILRSTFVSREREELFGPSGGFELALERPPDPPRHEKTIGN